MRILAMLSAAASGGAPFQLYREGVRALDNSAFA
jgi:hypothetical protein